ncbi:hypothetical protein [Halalkalibacterium halodurans]|uniref:hypothetical protein n=1 Tax=Halalkalibacterium halodurans TaxID=86665 RepID=UPI002AA9A3EE|nr:hypothetical protein [Halalkalibacterium halodurans]MDY7221812.1 hypothetical protein [Halalkalibacterium halodurans]MDY7241088.1 hypothetical protein [Halalkalibacterium halodurans]
MHRWKKVCATIKDREPFEPIKPKPVPPKRRKKRKPVDHCTSCGCHDSVCDCHFKAPVRKEAPLTSDCIVVDSLVCSKTVQKVAEITFPLDLIAPAGITIADIISINVVPDLNGITQNARIIQDKVVNIGLIPATITVTVLGVDLPLTLTTSLPFQEHTDCPGACPEDRLHETPLEVEGIFTQPGVPVLGVAGLELVEGILVKVILRTTITVTRPIVVDKDGHKCDLVPNRCQPFTTPPTVTFPAPPNGNGNGVGGPTP